jgi:hypothetical protein
MLSLGDQSLRGELTRLIAERGHAPLTHELAAHAGLSVPDTEAALQRLHDAHALLLHPGSSRPWVVHPFALSPGSCWVDTERGGFWANCLYCAFGIAAALRCDAVIATRIAGEAEPVSYSIRDATAPDTADVFHLSTPAARWWDNVIHACASFQPFHQERDIDAWCARHALPKGAVLTMPALWSFAQDWYGEYLAAPWRKRSPDEVRALFKRRGLVSPFWNI